MSTPKQKKTILKHFLEEFVKENYYTKIAKITNTSLSQPGCSHSNTIYDLQLQKTIVLRMQPRHRATLTQPRQFDLQRLSCKTLELPAMVSEIAAPKPDGCRRQSRKKTILKHFLKEFLKGKLLAPKLGKFADKSLSQPGCKGKLLAPKLRKFADKSLSQPGCSHSITINNLQLQKTIVLRMQPRHQATLTQPFQCDLQPRLQETHRTTHTGTTIVAKHIEGTKRPQPQPPHTHEVPFIAGCSHFTRKNTRFRAPAFSPQHTARNIHAAIPMRSTTTASRNA